MRASVTLIGLGAIGVIAALSQHVMTAPQSTNITPSAGRFADIARVLQSPRCMNCHTITSFPRQGDDRHPHRINVSRGSDNHGAAGLKCATCHVDHNQLASGVPGAPKWSLAPLSMGWEGLSVADLCRALKDEKKNGGRSVADLVKHMTEDPLVQWGWHPGAGRGTPPIDQDTFHKLVCEWAASGRRLPVVQLGREWTK